MKLKNLKKAPMEIVSLLVSNSNIVRLIYDDDATVLSNPKEINVPTTTLIEENYINLYPATETGINSIDRNTFIIVNLDDFSLQNADNNISVNGSIYITTDKAHSLLTDNKLRLLELADEIESTLENVKLSSAGKIAVTSIHYLVFSDFRSGYRLNIRLNDQQNRKAEL